MKLIIGFLSLTSILVFTACSNTETTETTNTTPVEQTAPETAKEPATAPAPVEESKNSTEIGVGEDGVSYKRKNGDNETKVNVTEDSKSVIIKK